MVDAVDKNIAESTNGEVAPLVNDKEQPSYKVIAGAKIPVSKQFGKLISGRKDQGKASMRYIQDAWQEAIRYYNNDQLKHRSSRYGASGNTYFTRKLTEQHSETENMVFSNTNTLVPLIYAKNPKPEITAANPAMGEFAALLERVVYVLAGMDYEPGFNLKPKMKQSVVLAALTNCAWMQTGYVIKTEGREQALADLNRVAQELVKAKDIKEIKRLEGEMMALEDSVNFLDPSGCKVRNRSPMEVIVDPTSMDPTHDDANWIITCDYLPTQYINAKYGEKDENGQVKSIYEPTHMLMGDQAGQGQDEKGESFSLFDKNAEPGAYGYENREAMEQAGRTLVWYYWDKITRRVYMFIDKKWDWPVWVWDDPYKLPRFFPLRKLYFHTPPVGCQSQGEVSYYLDQQDAINDINSEYAIARRWASRNIIYDKNKVNPDDVEKILKGPTGVALGVNVPDGMELKKMIDTMVPPSIQYDKLFDKADKYGAIDRIASVNEIMRGAQFKTNTTNKAIDYYSSSQNTRLDDKLDAIETFAGGIFADIAFMVLQFMTKDEVVQLVGEENEKNLWRNMQPDEIRRSFVFTCVGGSTQKPTSAAKKEEAIQVAQTLGQFAQAAPLSTMTVVLKLFEQAFDEINITDEDWQSIKQEFQQRAQAEMGPPAAPPQPDAPPEPNRVDTKLNLDPGKIMQALQTIDPRVLQAVATSLGKGVDIKEILPIIQQVLSGGTNVAQAPQ